MYLYKNVGIYASEFKLRYQPNKSSALKESVTPFQGGFTRLEDDIYRTGGISIWDKKIQDKILSNYFSSINFNSSPNLIANQKGSSVVLTNVNKPKSIREAGKLVEDMFS